MSLGENLAVMDLTGRVFGTINPSNWNFCDHPCTGMMMLIAGTANTYELITGKAITSLVSLIASVSLPVLLGGLFLLGTALALYCCTRSALIPEPDYYLVGDSAWPPIEPLPAAPHVQRQHQWLPSDPSELD